LVPSSLLGLVLFVVLLAPGLAYVLRHERIVPRRSYSTFRETLRVIFVSVACLTATAIVFAGLRLVFPRRTLNVHLLIQSPSDFARTQHVQLAWWGLGFVAVATALGALAADPRVVRWLHGVRDTKPGRWLTGAEDTQIRTVSAWYRLMHLYDADGAGPIAIGAQMDDGTYVEGQLYTFNVAPDEDEDRELVLSAPLHLTTSDGRRHGYAAQFTILSARHIARLDVTHLDPEQGGDDSAVVRPEHPPVVAHFPATVAVGPGVRQAQSE